MCPKEKGYWIRQGRKVQGPFPYSHVAAWIAKGRAVASMEYSRDGVAFSYGCDFPELFPDLVKELPHRPGTAVPTSALPEECRRELHEGESAVDFAFIDYKGGCLSRDEAKRWILVTDQRVRYEALVRNGGTYVATSGSIPISKISYVGTSSSKRSTGCLAEVVHLLQVSSSGSQIEIAVPAEPTARRLHEAIDVLISRK